MKEAYLELVPAEPKLKKAKAYNDEMKEFDAYLTRKPSYARPKKATIQRKYIKKDIFTWTEEQQTSFEAVKKAITDNAMAGADPEVQHHLAVDASNEVTGGCFFQLRDMPAGTEASPKVLKENVWQLSAALLK